MNPLKAFFFCFFAFPATILGNDHCPRPAADYRDRSWIEHHRLRPDPSGGRVYRPPGSRGNPAAAERGIQFAGPARGPFRRTPAIVEGVPASKDVSGGCLQPSLLSSDRYSHESRAGRHLPGRPAGRNACRQLFCQEDQAIGNRQWKRQQTASPAGGAPVFFPRSHSAPA